MQFIRFQCNNPDHQYNDEKYDSYVTDDVMLKQIIDLNYQTIVCNCSCYYNILSNINKFYSELSENYLIFALSCDIIIITNLVYSDKYGQFFVTKEKNNFVFKKNVWDCTKINKSDFLNAIIKNGTIIQFNIYDNDLIEEFKQLLEPTPFKLEIIKKKFHNHSEYKCLIIVSKTYIKPAIKHNTGKIEN
jgi:hypothetical protein